MLAGVRPLTGTTLAALPPSSKTVLAALPGTIDATLAAVPLLPEGFALPPLPYLVGLAVATIIVGVLLFAMRPPLTDWDVLALGAWMVVGATFHALYQIEAFPDWVAPLFGAPSVYVTTFVIAGAVWLFAVVGSEAGFFASIARLLGVVGANVAVVFIAFLAYLGVQSGTFSPLWPIIALVVSIAVTGVAFIGLSLTYTDAAAHTGKAGAFVVFAHSLDGVTTAVGVEFLGASERSPVPRAIMDVAADLPTAQYVGVGWLFVLVKVLLAVVILALFADYVREEPDRANAVLTGVAAVGLGPGAYNLLLYLVSATPA